MKSYLHSETLFQKNKVYAYVLYVCVYTTILDLFSYLFFLLFSPEYLFKRTEILIDLVVTGSTAWHLS